MTYFEWNKIISEHFFNLESAGKDILLYLAKQDVINIARPYFVSLSDEQIWEDFIHAIKFDERPTSDIPYSPISRPIELFSSWNKLDFPPPFVAYLILYIIPLTESYDEHFNATNYYGKVNRFFRNYQILNDFTERCIHTGNFQNLTSLWDALEEWSIITNNCDLGVFELKKFGNPNWIYVGKPLSQCVLPPQAIKKLPELFFEAGMIPNSFYAKEEIKKMLLKLGKKVLSLKETVIELVRRSQTNELGETIIEIVRREYIKWTGESHQMDENGTTQRTRRNYTVVPMILQFKINDNDGIITFSFRIHSTNEFPEELKFNDTEILYETNGWSKTLCCELKE